jgi:hypothetical protein
MPRSNGFAKNSRGPLVGPTAERLEGGAIVFICGLPWERRFIRRNAEIGFSGHIFDKESEVRDQVVCCKYDTLLPKAMSKL